MHTIRFFILSLYLWCPEHNRYSTKSGIGKLESKIKEIFSSLLLFQIVSRMVDWLAFQLHLLPNTCPLQARQTIYIYCFTRQTIYIDSFTVSYLHHVWFTVGSFSRAGTFSFTSHGPTHSTWCGAHHTMSGCPISFC